MASKVGESLEVGDRVSFKGQSGTSYRATIRYIGPLSGKQGDFVGCELRAPHGTNNGRGYFQCKDRHGIFIREKQITSVISKANNSGRRAVLSEDSNFSKPSKFTAARSHELNEQYMKEFEEGFENLRLAAGGVKSSNDSRRGPSAPRGGRTNVKSASGGARDLGFGWGGEHLSRSEMSPGWKRGPADPSGRLFDASDRNILCMTMFGNTCVVGSADHGLKEFNVETCRMTRNLYTKRFGHSEWVTCVTHLPDGRILSGGMDNKLCLWSAKGVSCIDLMGHSRSVSCVLASASGRHAISAGYDKTIRVWNTSGRGSEAACLSGHKAPVLCMDWARDGIDGVENGLLVTGARDGIAVVWDVGTGSDARVLEGHQGHITALSWLDAEPLCLTGAQDGRVRVWDARVGQPIAKIPAHIGGAVNDIVCAGVNDMKSGALIATSGADKKIQLLDPRAGFRPMYTLEHHKDFVYTMTSVGDLLLSGGGDGLLLVHDMSTGKLLYGLGANQGAVRCIAGTSNQMVVAGDDGNALVYDF